MSYRNGYAHWNLTDQVGTVRMRLNINGAEEEPYTSLPFGDWQMFRDSVGQWVLSNGDLGPVHFSGKPRDPETGLDDFGARYNSSQLGRFMTPDWSAQAEPVPYAKLDNPQSLNLYSYVLNNPVSLTDADGHFVGPGQGGDGTFVTYDWVRMEAGYGPAPRLPAVPPGAVIRLGRYSCICAAPDNPQPPPADENGNQTPPPIPLPPGKGGQRNSWRPVPGTGSRGTKWVPKYPVPSSEGGQPSANWDPEGHWDLKPGDGGPVQHFDPDGNSIPAEQAHGGSSFLRDHGGAVAVGVVVVAGVVIIVVSGGAAAPVLAPAMAF